ncbi:MAG: hypothetical protein ACLU5C_04500 [Acutalibacter sp.]
MENLGGETPAKRIFLHFMDKNAKTGYSCRGPGKKREESRMGAAFLFEISGELWYNW